MSFRETVILILAIIIQFLFLFHLQAQDLGSVSISGIEDRIALEEYIDTYVKTDSIRIFYADDLLDGIYLYESDNGRFLLDYLDRALAQKGLACLVYKKTNLVIIDRKQLQWRDQINGNTASGDGDYYSVVEIGDPVLAGKYKWAKLSGYIRNGKTGEPLPGAVIYDPKQDVGVVTNLNGFYSMELPVGKQVLQFSYVGFEEKNIQLNIISPGDLDIELFESTVAIDQVVITSNSDANVSGTEMSIIRLDAKTLDNIPVLMGEPDIMKSMTLLPGVQSSGDLASGFNVRGGSSDQNLIMIDGVPIYNSNHLFGLFSVIDTRMLQGVELFKGGAPAKYGGRISSVMDISLKEGNLKELEGDGALGLFSSKISLQGPIVKEKASFIVGGRFTYSDWILNRVPDVDIRESSANFHDLNLKMNYTVNPRNRLSLFGYYSYDKFNLANKDIFEYSNKLGSVKWSHIAGEKLTFSVNVFITDYTTLTTQQSNPANSYRIATGIQQMGTKFRVLSAIGSKHSLEAGLEANNFILFPGKQEIFDEESVNETEELQEKHALELAGYIQDVYDLSERFSISAGLRYSYFVLLGPSTVNLYEGGEYVDNTSFSGFRDYDKGEIIKNYSGLEPRLSFRYSLTTSSSVKLGYNRNYQYFHILSNSTVIMPTDTWTTSDLYIKPAVGDQVMAGYFKNFKRGVYETSVELYYKKVSNLLEFKDGAVLVMNQSIEQDLLSADMQAYGVEFLVRKNSGRLTGWVSYALSRSFIKTSGAPADQLINRGEQYPSSYDKPHDVSAVASYKISRRFTLGATFTYSTGRPTSYPEVYVPIYSNNLVYYSDRNKYRLKDYHRLDISITWDTSLKKKKKFYSSWILSVYNVYGRKNVYSTYYQKNLPSNMNDYKTYALYELSIIGVPIPSLTYNIRF
ncbi:MAG: TonB-dependent receptor [Bacteroidales bacterium]|jgi:hypothetical protein